MRISEKYVLVLSHDEVVHLKCSMLNKMPGLGFDKFANLKVGYAFMMGHVGKKLLFMGQDFAQLQEWSEARVIRLVSFLQKTGIDSCRNLQKICFICIKRIRRCNELDCSPEGFEWVNADDAERSIYSFIRHSKERQEEFFCLYCNFTPMERAEYRCWRSKEKAV